MRGNVQRRVGKVSCRLIVHTIEFTKKLPFNADSYVHTIAAGLVGYCNPLTVRTGGAWSGGLRTSVEEGVGKDSLVAAAVVVSNIAGGTADRGVEG